MRHQFLSFQRETQKLSGAHTGAPWRWLALRGQPGSVLWSLWGKEEPPENQGARRAFTREVNLAKV